MTKNVKYILVGGYLHKAPDEGLGFTKEFVKNFKDKKPIKMLNCIFADPAKAKEKFEEDKVRVARFVDGLEMELAVEEKFLEQVKNSDVIFFRGGDTETLIEALKRCGNWVSLLEGKTVAGTSAGAMMLSAYSHALLKDEIIEGFGLVPIKIITHWHSDLYEVDWEKALLDLRSYKTDLPVLTIKEGEFQVFES